MLAPTQIACMDVAKRNLRTEHVENFRERVKKVINQNTVNISLCIISSLLGSVAQLVRAHP